MGMVWPRPFVPRFRPEHLGILAVHGVSGLATGNACEDSGIDRSHRLGVRRPATGDTDPELDVLFRRAHRAVGGGRRLPGLGSVVDPGARETLIRDVP